MVERRSSWFALGWILIVAVAAVSASALPLADPSNMDLLLSGAGPSGEHWLGTDRYGRDLLSRLVYGARTSLWVGMLAPLLGLVAGGVLGLLASYWRGPTERLILVFLDILMSFPGLILALGVIAFLGQSLRNVILVLGTLSISTFARLIRAQMLSALQHEFVHAARALGVSPCCILVRHVLPQTLPTIVSYALLVVAVMIAAEGTLSFLGLGVPPPTPSWGGMIAEGRDYLSTKPRLSLLPAGAVFLTVLSLNLLSERIGTWFTVADMLRTHPHRATAGV